MQILFFSLLLQVLKPVTEQYMGDNMRQTVMNSIRASLTEQGSQQTRLKTDWCSSSSTLPVIVIIILHWLGVFSPRTVKLVQHQSWPTFFLFFLPNVLHHIAAPLFICLSRTWGPLPALLFIAPQCLSSDIACWLSRVQPSAKTPDKSSPVCHAALWCILKADTRVHRDWWW